MTDKAYYESNFEDATKHADVVQTIILWRIYDVLLLLLTAQDPAVAAQVARMHEQGEFVGPNPAWKEPEDNE